MARIHLVLLAAELAAHSSVVAEIPAAEISATSDLHDTTEEDNIDQILSEYGIPEEFDASVYETYEGEDIDPSAIDLSEWEEAEETLLEESQALGAEDRRALQEEQPKSGDAEVSEVSQKDITSMKFSAADMHMPAPSSNTTMSMRMKIITSNPVFHHIEYNGMYYDDPWHWFQTFTPHPNSPIYEHGGNPFACNEVTYTSGDKYSEKNKYHSDDGDKKFWDTDCCAYDPTDNESNGPLTPHTPPDTFYGSCVPGFTVKRGDRGCGYEGNKYAIYSTICIRNEENDIVIEKLQTIEEALEKTGCSSRIHKIAEWLETETKNLNALKNYFVKGWIKDPRSARETVTILKEQMVQDLQWLFGILRRDIPAANAKKATLFKELLPMSGEVMEELQARLLAAVEAYQLLESKTESVDIIYGAIQQALGTLKQLEAMVVQVEATFIVVVEPSCEDKLADSEQATQECETEKGGLNLGSARMMKEIGDLSAKLEQCGSELTKAEECSYKGELNECKAEKGELKKHLVKELEQCGSELTLAEGKLATTADKLQKCARESAQCNSDKAKCTSDKAKCAEDLVARTNELRECNDDLQSVETEVGEAYNHIVDFEFSEARDRLVDAKEVLNGEEPSCRLQTTDETEGVVGYHQVGAYGADISGCGMQNCDDRYDTKSEQECAARCDGMSECVAFTYAPVGGDKGKHVPKDATVCTLYDSNVPTQTWTNSAGEGVQVFCARNEESSTTTTTTTTMRAEDYCEPGPSFKTDTASYVVVDIASSDDYDDFLSKCAKIAPWGEFGGSAERNVGPQFLTKGAGRCYRFTKELTENDKVDGARIGAALCGTKFNTNKSTTPLTLVELAKFERSARRSLRGGN